MRLLANVFGYRQEQFLTRIRKRAKRETDVFRRKPRIFKYRAEKKKFTGHLYFHKIVSRVVVSAGYQTEEINISERLVIREIEKSGVRNIGGKIMTVKQIQGKRLLVRVYIGNFEKSRVRKEGFHCSNYVN